MNTHPSTASTNDDDILDVFVDSEWDDPEDWEEDDDIFLDEIIEMDNRAFVKDYTESRKGSPTDFDYDYDRDDYPYGYGAD